MGVTNNNYSLILDLNVNPELIEEVEKICSSVFRTTQDYTLNEQSLDSNNLKRIIKEIENMVEGSIINLYHLKKDIDTIGKIKRSNNPIIFKNICDNQMLDLMILLGSYQNNFDSKLFTRGKFKEILKVKDLYFDEAYGDDFVDQKLRNSFHLSFKKWFDNNILLRDLLAKIDKN